jgi:hypothetical protein
VKKFQKRAVTTKPLQRTRPEKPEWFVVLLFILAPQRMIDHWGDFNPATILCRRCPRKFSGLSTRHASKITIAPDKDLLQNF